MQLCVFCGPACMAVTATRHILECASHCHPPFLHSSADHVNLNSIQSSRFPSFPCIDQSRFFFLAAPQLSRSTQRLHVFLDTILVLLWLWLCPRFIAVHLHSCCCLCISLSFLPVAISAFCIASPDFAIRLDLQCTHLRASGVLSPSFPQFLSVCDDRACCVLCIV